VHLKSLTIRGFKSFASTTTFEFEPGVTCVVGPNGSGKSNVVDAIAWVMGEQGAKSLRGGKMEDVIFAGTTSRPPLGRAEVELVIDNADGALPIDFVEVRISRILFRSGGSEYSINGEPARLLDVQELLSDSGIGREMHVIVGQGRLDSMLQATPEERRGFVEEAAGVLKHRKRKEKALRKLDSMAANLVRLQDLTGELRRQLKPLGRQAAVARRAAVVQADVRDAKLRLLADDYGRAVERLSREEADEAALLARRREVESELAGLRERQGRIEENLSAAAPRLREVTDIELRLTSLQERLTGMIRLTTERLRHLEEVEPEQLGIFDPDQLAGQIEQVRVELARLTAEAELARAALSTRVGDRERAEADLSAASSEAKENRRLVQEWRQRVAGLESRISSARSRAEARRNEIERSIAQLEHGRDGLIELRDELVALDEGATGLAGDCGRSGEDADLAEARSTEAREAVSRARVGERELGEAWAAADARARALAQSVTEPTSARELREAGIEILGAASDLIVVDGGWERAVDAALAEVGGALAVADWQQALSGVQRPEGKVRSRTTLLVAEAAELVRSRPARSPGPSGALFLADVVRPAPGASDDIVDIIRFLLRQVVLVGDIDAAMAVIRSDPGLTAVTRDGHLFTGGLVVSGPVGAGAIQQRDRAAAARREADELAERLAGVRSELAGLESDHERLAQLATEARKVADAAGARQSDQARVRGVLVARIEVIEQQARRAEQSVEQARKALADDEAGVARLEVELDAERDGRPVENHDVAQRIVALEQKLTKARQAEVESRLAARSAEERIAAQSGRLRELEQTVAAERRAIQERERRGRRRREQAVVARRVLVGAEAALTVTESALTRIRADRDEVESGRREGEAELGAVRGRVDELSARQSELVNSYHRDEVVRAEQRLRIEQFEVRAREEFGLATDSLVAEYGPDQLVPPSPPAPGDEVDASVPLPEPRPFVRSEQEKRLREAEKAMALLGRVNPLALEEFAAMEERHAFLTTQVEDLKQSRRDLLQIVSEVDDRVRQVFAEAFVDVQREFGAVFGRLFPGGEGRLVLTNPDDLLTTGVEVEARPAGKKVKRLSLLSGGERSMAAMAFLIALFRARPAPFYLLDEVEAALDDHNLGRLIGALRELSDNSQLLVITHQKRTMEIADALYGVTMREGVTKVVSQRMRQLQDA